MEKEFKIFGAFAVVAMLIYLGIAGFIIWVIVKLLQFWKVI